MTDAMDIITGLVASALLSTMIWAPVLLILNKARQAQRGVPPHRTGRAHPDDYGGGATGENPTISDTASANNYDHDHELYSDVDEGAGE